MMKGIDVAKWNGNIDWNKVKAAGVEFAVLKVINKSNKTEEAFVRNYAGAAAQGLHIDVYNYLYTITETAARTAAKAVVNTLAGRKVGKVWADAEDTCLKNKGIKLVRILNAYKEVIEAAGYEFGVYTGLSFYNSYIKPYKEYIDCDFWIARYPSTKDMTITMDPPASKKPAICHNLWGWQHSSRGRVPGISGYVDMDICYTDTWLDMEFFNDPAYQDKKKELMDKMMPYQLNDEFLEGSHAIVFHDMPMHVGFEISKEVEMKNLDHILDQAENRRHAEKAVMYTLIKGI